jgi:hypothetical protein
VQHGFSGLHTRIRHERMIIPRSSETFWGTNAGSRLRRGSRLE